MVELVVVMLAVMVINDGVDMLLVVMMAAVVI